MDKAETGDKLNHQEGLPPQSLSLVIEFISKKLIFIAVECLDFVLFF